GGRRDRLGERRQQQGRVPRLLAPSRGPRRRGVAIRQERHAHRARGDAEPAAPRQRPGAASERGDVPGSAHARDRRRAHRALLVRREPLARQHHHPPARPRCADADRHRQPRLGTGLPVEPDRGHPRLSRGACESARVSVDALHRRSPRQAGHPRRPGAAPAVHGGHRRELAESHRHRRLHPLLREAPRQPVGGVQGRAGRDGRAGGRTRDREVHRRARSSGRLHREHDVPGPAVHPARPWLRVVGAPLMASLQVRAPIGDHLLTPENAALLVIDYQPSQFSAVHSIDQDLLLQNIVSTVKTAKAFGMPIVNSTINVATGRGKPTVPELAKLLEDYTPIDRTSTNAWEDADFLAAVRATGRRKLILCALWTEICMAFPALDAMRQGYDVYPVVDAIGGTSEEAHRAGLQRVLQAGAKPTSWVALAVELQRDWARLETVQEVVQIVLTDRLLKEE